MNPAYQAWIDGHVTTVQAARGRCREVSAQMAFAFCELRRVRGHYWDPLTNREAPHWWLVDPEGNVVDPTACQFSGAGEYRPLDESLPEPTGKCVNCGGLVYDGSNFCGRDCGEQAAKELNELLRRKP